MGVLKEMFSALRGGQSCKKYKHCKRRTKRSRRTRRKGRKSRKGGNILKNAVIPFGLLALQKYTSDRTKSQKIQRRRYNNKLY